MPTLCHTQIRSRDVIFSNGDRVSLDENGTAQVSEETLQIALSANGFFTPDEPAEPADPEVLSQNLFESLVIQVKEFALEHGLSFWLKRGNVEIASEPTPAPPDAKEPEQAPAAPPDAKEPEQAPAAEGTKKTQARVK